MTFASTAGSLQLDHSGTFSGEIFNFSGNGTLSGSDHIDLRDIKYGSVQDSYANGVLTVTDGIGDIAKLSFNGSYTLANFDFASDGAGGTVAYDPPAPSSSGQSATPPNLALLANYMASTFAAAGNDHCLAIIGSETVRNSGPPLLANPHHA